MNKKIVGVFLVGLAVGVSLGYLIPYLLPRKTIYDRLRKAQISFNRKGWYVDNLQRAEYIDHIEYFEWFTRAFEEKDESRGAYDSIHVYLDPSFNVVWIEVWLDNSPANLQYLGFHIYSEPD